MAPLKTEWDAVVLGAGPAGALTARLLANDGVDVLLIDKEKFPRAKVCGCCLSARAVQELNAAGLESVLSRERAIKVNEFVWKCEGKTARFLLKGGMSLSRSRLDQALVEESKTSGASFLDESKASVRIGDKEYNEIKIQTPYETFSIRAKITVIATGLHQDVFENKSDSPLVVQNNSYIGCASTLEDNSSLYEYGHIYMASSPEGYCGLVRTEDGRLNAAAALNPSSIKKTKSIVEVVSTILKRAHFELPEALPLSHWKGTPPLSCSRKSVSGPRYFMLGDSSYYKEPFTGEGMYWAMAQARLLAALLQKHAYQWKKPLSREWQSLQQQFIRKHAFGCGLVAKTLRSPFWSRQAVRCFQTFPQLANRLANHFHG